MKHYNDSEVNVPVAVLQNALQCTNVDVSYRLIRMLTSSMQHESGKVLLLHGNNTVI